jgi:hypothetical protein
MVGLSIEERLRFYVELAHNLALTVSELVDRAIDPTEKIDQIGSLARIIQLATHLLRQEGQHDPTDLDFAIVTGAFGSMLDRQTRKALVRAVANSYHAATGRDIG